MSHPRLDAPSLSRRDLLRNATVGAGALAAGVTLGGVTAAPAAAAPAAAAVAAAAPLKLARVWAFNAAQRAMLADFDDTHNVFNDGSVEYLLWPGDQAKLDAAGVSYEITVEDLVARDQALLAADSGVSTVALQPGQTAGEYRRLADFEKDMRALVARFPDKARLLELPEKTLEGRTVYGIEIASDVNRNDGRPVYYNDGVHHAREWPAAELPIMWAFDLLESYGTDARITNIVDNVRNIIVPVVNPDGYHLSREFPVDQSLMGLGQPQIAQGQYVRKNRRSLLGDAAGQHGPANASSYGVDPNRNYAYAWGDNIGGSSSDRTSQTYRGTQPFSEPESRNVSAILRSHHATAMITHHTSGNLVLWAWGDTLDAAPDDALLQGLGRACATYNGYKPQKSIQLYATTGTTSDYAYGVFGSIGYTFEHAGSSFHPAYKTTVPAMYAKNREALLLLCEEGCLPPELRPDRPVPPVLEQHTPLGVLNHAVVTGRLVDAAGNGVAGTVTLYKQFETLLWKNGNGGNPLGKASVTETIETVMDTNADGTFTYHVNPSTRPYLTFKGQRETYTLTAAGAGGSAVRDVFVARGERLDLGDVALG
jgi:murein tripeptide amidase MpaA